MPNKSEEKDFLGIDVSQLKDINILVSEYFKMMEYLCQKEGLEIFEIHLIKDSKYIVVKYREPKESEDSEESTEPDFEWI